MNTLNINAGEKFINKETAEVIEIISVDSTHFYYDYIDGSGEGCIRHSSFEADFHPVYLLAGDYYVDLDYVRGLIATNRRKSNENS